MNTLSSSCTVLFACFFIALVKSDARGCPRGKEWFRLDCSCFLVASSSPGLTWNAAKQRCPKSYSSTLASNTSVKENNELALHLDGKLAWIDLRAEVNSSVQLNGGKQEVVKKPVCIATRAANMWTAKNCLAKHHYICEKPATPDCPSGWRQFRNSCYINEVSKERTDFEKAHQNCVAQNASLVEISTKEEYQFVRKNLSNASYMVVWSGLHKPVNATQYSYRHNSRHSGPKNYEELGVQFRANRENTTEYCVVIEIGINDAFWEAKPCDTKLEYYLCKTDVKRAFKIDVTKRNETSARISFSIVDPTNCGMPKDGNLKLVLLKGDDVIYSLNITGGHVWLNKLRPQTQYRIELTENNTRLASKDFATTQIENPLRVFTNISTTNVQASIGQTVALVCAGEGEPPIKFGWEKNKRSLQSYAEMAMPHPSSVLVAKLDDKSSYGEYICHIQDQFGNITHRVLIARVPEDDDEENQDSFIIVIVILAIAVAILLLITFYLARHLNALKRNLKVTSKANSVKLTNISQESVLYENSAPGLNRVTKNRPNAPTQDEEEMYTALSRNRNDEENLYTNLRTEARYVNTTELNN